MSAIVVPRRSFLAGLGLAVAGLAVGIESEAAPPKPSPPGVAGAVPPVAAGDGGLHPNVFVHIGLDGLATIVCHRSEMGTGVTASLPVLIADELGADMARVKIVQADGDPAYGDQNTDGSRSVRTLYDGMCRMPEAPSRIHVEILESEAPPGGIGEPGVPPVAPAIANAVFALTGVRHRELPMRA